MDATSTNSYDITSASAWGTVGGDCTTAAFGISPTVTYKKPLRVPQKVNKVIPRIHKDKNGCVKKSYWETQPIDVGDYAFAGLADISAYTISTSGVASMTMGDASDSFHLSDADVCT